MTAFPLCLSVCFVFVSMYSYLFIAFVHFVRSWIMFFLQIWITAVGSYLGHVLRLGYQKDSQLTDFISANTPAQYEHKRASVTSIGIVNYDLPYTRRPNYEMQGRSRSPSRSAQTSPPSRQTRSLSRASRNRSPSPARPRSRNPSPMKSRQGSPQKSFQDRSRSKSLII